jgi:hypothetical protein
MEGTLTPLVRLLSTSDERQRWMTCRSFVQAARVELSSVAERIVGRVAISSMSGFGPGRTWRERSSNSPGLTEAGAKQ